MRTHYCTQMSGLNDWINILSSTTNPKLKSRKLEFVEGLINGEEYIDNV